MPTLGPPEDFAALKAENEALRRQVADLERQVLFLTTHSTLAAGMAGETIISKIISGKMTPYAEAFDVATVGGLRLEVKYARLNRHSKESLNTRRWPWGKVFGESGNKNYDFLILVGEADETYREKYKSPESPYVIFCLPFNEVYPLTMPQNGGRYRCIQLTSNPHSLYLGPKAKRLFENFKQQQRTSQSASGF